MKAKPAMIASALLMGLVGISLTFLPQETATLFQLKGNSEVLLQILGALYFGFAMMNWMAKGQLIGGIYGRPIAIGNFAHFLIAALALSKYSFRSSAALPLIVVTVIYCVLAMLFAYLLFTHPLKKDQ